MARSKNDPPPSPDSGDITVPNLPVVGSIGSIPDPEPEPGATPEAPGSPEPGPGGAPGDEQAPKRRRRRKKTEPAAAEPPAPPISAEEKAVLAKALGKTFAGAARVAARKRGDHWLLSADESGALGDAWAEALGPYLGALAKHAPIVAAVLVTYEVIDARLSIDALREVPPAAGALAA